MNLVCFEPNFVRCKPSGKYYARVRVAGKLHPNKPWTAVFSVEQSRAPMIAYNTGKLRVHLLIVEL